MEPVVIYFCVTCMALALVCILVSGIMVLRHAIAMRDEDDVFDAEMQREGIRDDV